MDGPPPSLLPRWGQVHFVIFFLMKYVGPADISVTANAVSIGQCILDGCQTSSLEALGHTFGGSLPNGITMWLWYHFLPFFNDFIHQCFGKSKSHLL